MANTRKALLISSLLCGFSAVSFVLNPVAVDASGRGKKAELKQLRNAAEEAQSKLEKEEGDLETSKEELEEGKKELERLSKIPVGKYPYDGKNCGQGCMSLITTGKCEVCTEGSRDRGCIPKQKFCAGAAASNISFVDGVLRFSTRPMPANQPNPARDESERKRVALSKDIAAVELKLRTPVWEEIAAERMADTYWQARVGGDQPGNKRKPGNRTENKALERPVGETITQSEKEALAAERSALLQELAVVEKFLRIPAIRTPSVTMEVSCTDRRTLGATSMCEMMASETVYPELSETCRLELERVDCGFTEKQFKLAARSKRLHELEAKIKGGPGRVAVLKKDFDKLDARLMSEFNTCTNGCGAAQGEGGGIGPGGEIAIMVGLNLATSITNGILVNNVAKTARRGYVNNYGIFKTQCSNVGIPCPDIGFGAAGGFSQSFGNPGFGSGGTYGLPGNNPYGWGGTMGSGNGGAYDAYMGASYLNQMSSQQNQTNLMAYQQAALSNPYLGSAAYAAPVNVQFQGSSGIGMGGLPYYYGSGLTNPYLPGNGAFNTGMQGVGAGGGGSSGICGFGTGC